MKEILLQLSNVGLSYEKKEIFSDLNFSVTAGECIGLLGPNGCGKTSLLNLIAGTLTPDHGEILLVDKPIRNYSRRELARIVSVLPQETLIDFPFTALEVVLMGRAPYLGRFQWETEKDLSIARQAMSWTDCLDFAGRDIRSLSGGERERVLLARALTQDPKLLLLDEPTTHLDLRHQAELFQLLRRLHAERGLTLMVVLHDLHFAARACDRVLLLGEGRLQADGPPSDVMNAATLQKTFGTEILCGTASGRSFFLPLLP